MIIGGAKLFKPFCRDAWVTGRSIGCMSTQFFLGSLKPGSLMSPSQHTGCPFYRLPDVEHQLVERKVQIGIVHPVIGNLERKSILCKDDARNW